MTNPIILASGSEIRQKMLRSSGVPFDIVTARVDEEAIRHSLTHAGAKPRDVVDQLAVAKAHKVAQKHPDRFVLGCDQILIFKDRILSKPLTKQDATSQIRSFSGKTQTLMSAAVIYENGQPVWRHIGQVKLHIGQISEGYLADYVQRNWESIRHSVGGYKIEEEGARLIRRIEGDYFNVLGMPLLEILAYLNLRGVIEG